MSIFSSNRDLDSTITTIGIHLLMAGALYIHSTGNQQIGSIMTELLIAYTGICSYLFGKGRAEATQNGSAKS